MSGPGEAGGNRVLSITFPNHVGAIEKLRAHDAAFEEICRDYETLLRMLPLDTRNPKLDVLQESLDALKDEILSYLSQNEDGTNPSEDPSKQFDQV